MGIEITVSNVSPLRDGVWEAAISPREVRTLGSCSSSLGEVTVLLLSTSSFDSEAKAIRFAPQAATVLNVGNSSRAIIVNGGDDLQLNERPTSDGSLVRLAGEQIGPGDKQYLQSLADLPDQVRQAGEEILRRVRRLFPGDLRPLGGRRFQETPDNFWFVVIQPRAGSLLITVRGLPDRFKVERLKIVEDRPPYSRFKVRSADDVPEAVQVILHAVRRKT